MCVLHYRDSMVNLERIVSLNVVSLSFIDELTSMMYVHNGLNIFLHFERTS